MNKTLNIENVLSKELNYLIFGLFTHWKGYKVSWHINNITDYNLSRHPDISIDLGQDIGFVSNYVYKTDNFILKLLENKIYDSNNKLISFLIKEIYNADYLIYISEVIKKFDSQNFVSSMETLQGITYIHEINHNLVRDNNKFLVCIE